MRISTVLLLAALAAGCRTPSPLYTAQDVTPETVVDGQADEWPQALRPVPREAALSIGLRRAPDALVVAVIAGDERQARRIALGGLRLWIDPEGGRDRVLGIRFPAPEPLGDRVLQTTVRAQRDGRTAAPDALRRRFESSLGSVEITRGETPPQRLTPGTIDGLETAATWGPRRLVIEMRVPLDASEALLPRRAGSALGVGVELVDVQETVRQRRAAPRQRPARGEAPDLGESPEAQAAPPVEVETVTRWLRLE